MHKSRRVRITDINPHLSCVLCKGYLIDATTIIECLHSFCRSCIVRYLECNKYCPICDVQVHKTKPLLNIRSDQTLQDIVYKLVPGLFQNEMCRRRDFYAKHPDHRPSSAEESGQVTQFSHIYTADESISLSLEYYNNNDSLGNDNNSPESRSKAHSSRRYLRCPAAVSVAHLQKLIRAKYGLSCEHRVDILYMHDKLNEDFTLMDIAYIYLWRRKGPLHLTYRIFEVAKRIKLNESIKDEPEIKREDEGKSAEEPCPNRKWKEVQLQISENGVMSVTNIEEAKPELVSSNVLEVKPDLNLLQPELADAPKTERPAGAPAAADAAAAATPDRKPDARADEGAAAESKLGKHKLQECSEDKPPLGKIMRPSFTRTPNILKNVQQLSRHHPLKIHSQLVAKSNASAQPAAAVPASAPTPASTLAPAPTSTSAPTPASTPAPAPTPAPTPTLTPAKPLQLQLQLQLSAKPACAAQSAPDKTINNNNTGKPSPPPTQKELATTTLPNTVQSNAPPVQSTPKTVAAVTTSQCPLADKSAAAAPNCVATSAGSAPVAVPSLATDTSSFGSTPTPNIPKYTQAGQSTDNTTTTTSTKPDTLLQNSVAKPPAASAPVTVPAPAPALTPALTSAPHELPNNCIQSSKVSIVPKKTPIKIGAPIGYKTLRDPPKAWNPQISRQNLVKANVFNSNNGASTSDVSKLDTRTPTKPNKFFKRNNMPRYLGNPASGVKPMYQVRDGDKSPPESKKVPDLKKPAFDNKNNNNNKEENKTRTDTATENKIRQQSIIKIDPKTLKPITDKPAVPEIPSCSDISEMKINQSTVPIFNPLRTQKSQTSPKIERRSPKTSTAYQDIQNSPKSPKDRSSPKINSKPLNSPTSKKDKLSINFTPPNPFIPNLTSPNVAPNQFLYPNFHSYDPRIIGNLPAYHSLPFSMFYSQPRLNYPGLSSQNLPLSPNLMSSLNLEVNKSLRKNFEIPCMMQLSPPPDLKKPATCVKNSRENYTEEKSSPAPSEKPVETKSTANRSVKAEKGSTQHPDAKPPENNGKQEESQAQPREEPEQSKAGDQDAQADKSKAEVAAADSKAASPEKVDTVVKTNTADVKDSKEETETKPKETVPEPKSDDKTCENTSKAETVAPCS